MNRTVRIALPVAAVVIAALVAAAWFLTRSGDGSISSARTFTAGRGSLTIDVNESGTIRAREQIVIKSEVEGRTTILELVPEGTEVKKGDLLVRLDASSLEDQSIDQEIRVQNAEAAFVRAREDLEVIRNQARSDVEKADLEASFAIQDLEKYKDGEFPQQVRESEARIALADEELKRAEENLKWSRTLSEEKYLSQTELQADELAANKARLDLELARSELELLQTYTYRRKIDELNSEVSQKALALERTRTRAGADVVQAEAELIARRSEFEREQSKLQKIKKQITKTRIFAPAAGLVVYATSAQFSFRSNTEPLAEGQEVREQQELIYLPTTSAYIAQVKVHESSLDKIQPGQQVSITVDALPGRTYLGKVTRIAPLPDPQSVFLNPDLKVYQTDIDILDEDPALRTGMSCRARILVTRYDDAVFVPIQAVVRVDGRHRVYVKEADGFVPRDVSVGLDNNNMIHVIEGLQGGEEVMLTPPLDAERTAPEKRGDGRPGGGTGG